jgi:hypothetical protein
LERIDPPCGAHAPSLAKLARLSALAAALALAAPAVAAPRSATAPPAKAPATLAPSRPAAAAPLAPSRQAPAPVADAVYDGPVDPTWQFGPALGFEFGMGDLDYGAVKLRIEGQREIHRVSPITTVSFVASLGMMHPSGEESVPVVVDPFFGTIVSGSVQWDANVFELIPGARVTYAANPRVSLFADGGLGLVYTTTRSHLSAALSGLPEPELAKDGFGGVLRLAGGLVVTPSPAVRIALEVVGLHLRFGDGLGTGFAVLASLSHRL